MRNNKNSWANKIPAWAWGVISLLVALVVWYLMSIGESTGRAFPFAPTTIEGLVRMIKNGAFFADLASSLISVGAGFALGFIIALPVAILMAWYLPIRNVLNPWIQFVRNIPPLAYVPLIVMTAGVDVRLRSRSLR